MSETGGPAPAPLVRFGTVVQLAYRVGDLTSAALHWVDRMRVGPFFLRDHGPMACADAEGRRGSFLHSSGFAQWGDVQVELVQLHAVTPDPLAAELRTPTGVHHVATFTEDFDREKQRLTELGWPPLLTGWTASGTPFAFHDARGTLGHFVEIYEPAPQIRRLYGRVAEAAADWDGSEPLRHI